MWMLLLGNVFRYGKRGFVPRDQHRSAALPFVISTGAQRSGEISVWMLLLGKVLRYGKRGFVPRDQHRSAALPFVISTGAQRSGEISVWMLLLGKIFRYAQTCCVSRWPTIRRAHPRRLCPASLSGKRSNFIEFYKNQTKRILRRKQNPPKDSVDRNIWGSTLYPRHPRNGVCAPPSSSRVGRGKGRSQPRRPTATAIYTNPKLAVGKLPMLGKIVGSCPALTPNHCARVAAY